MRGNSTASLAHHPYFLRAEEHGLSLETNNPTFTNLSAVPNQTNRAESWRHTSDERRPSWLINYAKLFNRRVTPQSQPIPGSTQVRQLGRRLLVAGR